MGCTASATNLSALSVEINDFVQKITADVGSTVLDEQRRKFKCGNLLKNPLPLDTASHPNREDLMLQLIHTVGLNPLKLAHESMSNADCQSRNVLCSVAASGMGKTHMVYSLGLSKRAYCIMIRVGTPTGQLSKPWQSLVEENEREKKRCRMESTDLASLCMHYIHVLILCYMEVTCMVIKSAKTSEFATEILLRFHRNCRAEAIISRLFDKKLKQYFSDGKTFTSQDVRSIVSNERENLHEKFTKLDLKLPFLLCFDEIQVLMKMCPIFYSTDHYIRLREGHQNSIADVSNRDLFYATFYVMNELMDSEKWTMFMTGTCFSLNLSSTSPNGFSSARRGKIVAVVPEVLMTVNEMILILKHYWNFEDAVLYDENIQRSLQKFCGRPLLFVDGVFQLLCNATNSTIQPLQSLSVEFFQTILNRGHDLMVRHFMGIVNAIFEAPSTLPEDRSLSTWALIPTLVEYVMFGFKLKLDKTKDQAIASGIFAFQAMKDNSLLTHEEPLVLEAARNTLVRLLGQNYNAIFYQFAVAAAEVFDSKGDIAEYLVAVDIALQARLESLNGSHLNLAKYLSRFGIQQPNLEVWIISDNIVPAEPYSSKEYNPGSTFYRVFRDATSINKVFYGIPQTCGGDLALEVKHFADGKMRTAVIQLKNENKTHLKELSMALHPSTQYLNNYPRNFLICNISPWRISNMTSSVVNFEDHVSFYQNDGGSEILSNWIRIGLTACKIDDRSLQISRELCDDDDLFVLGCLNSPEWLSEDTRKAFFKYTNSLTVCDASKEEIAVKCMDLLLNYKPANFEFNLIPTALETKLKSCRNANMMLPIEELRGFVDDKADLVQVLLAEEIKNNETFLKRKSTMDVGSNNDD